jgi:hypothetical protein
MCTDAIFFRQKRDVTGLGDGIAAEVDNAWRRCLEKLVDYRLVHASAWRVNDNDLLAGDVVEGFFAGRMHCGGATCLLLYIALHLTHSVIIDLYQGASIASNGQSNRSTPE